MPPRPLGYRFSRRSRRAEHVVQQALGLLRCTHVERYVCLRVDRDDEGEEGTALLLARSQCREPTDKDRVVGEGEPNTERQFDAFLAAREDGCPFLDLAAPSLVIQSAGDRDVVDVVT